MPAIQCLPLMRPLLLALLLCLLLAPSGAPAQAQPECGYVDAIDYPIDISDTIRQGYDDFSLFRSRFGGLHAGIDIGFNRRGDIVRAAARGRVTYSDINGWDTEKGVVIVEHTFPDNSVAYSLYGHMEEANDVRFPIVGACVTMGDILGTIGWPSRGLPHLHYELRDFLPNDGGPGYTQENPLTLGWYHPLDFTLLWRARLNPATSGYATFADGPTLPPVLLDTGYVVMASGDTIFGYVPPYTAVWSIQMDGVITGIAGLPGGRVIARSRTGQVIQIIEQSIVAAWTAEGRDAPFVALGETLIFGMADGGLSAFTALGQALWTLAGDGNGGRLVSLQANHNGVAVAQRSEGQTRWRMVDVQGTVLQDTQFTRNPVFAPAPTGWKLLDGMDVVRVDASASSMIGSVGGLAGRTAAMTVDAFGNTYVYLGDSDSTLVAVDESGATRWRVRYPAARLSQAPLMDVGGSCLLYTLDDDGMLNVFNTMDGALLQQIQLYAGGVQNSHPRARLLRVDEQERALVGAGFLSLIALDGNRLGGDALQSCLLG